MNHPNHSNEEGSSSDKSKSVNDHFKRESRLMIWFAVGVPVILLLGAFLLGPALLTFIGR